LSDFFPLSVQTDAVLHAKDPGEADGGLLEQKHGPALARHIKATAATA